MLNWSPILQDNDGKNYMALATRQFHAYVGVDTHKNTPFCIQNQLYQCSTKKLDHRHMEQ